MKKWFIKDNISIKEAMLQMKQIGEKTLFIVSEGNILKGCISDGDIRKWIIAKGDLRASIKKVYNKKTVFFYQGYDLNKVKKKFIALKIDSIPIVDKGKIIKEILTWDKVFSQDGLKSKRKAKIKAVIMAGGKGTRLDPVTRILPKPLMPIGDKSIIEHIIERLNNYGINNFYVSVHHKAKLIKAYFEEQDLGNIKFIEEDTPLGTAGSLSLLKNSTDKRFLVTNCDILLDIDIVDFLEFHKKEKFDMTIVVSCKHYILPYGICEIETGGKLLTIKEKPTFDYLVNTGMYIINKELLQIIPKGIKYDINNLIEDAKGKNFSIGVYPIEDKLWTDIGEWDEYNKVLNY